MISAELVDALEQIARDARCAIPVQRLNELFSRSIDRLPPVQGMCAVELPAQRLAPIADEIERDFGCSTRSAFGTMLVARLALKRIPALDSCSLPDSVLSLYPSAVSNFVSFVASADLTNYFNGDDAFLKDVRVAAGYSVPCGAQDVDLHSSISKLSGVKGLLARRELMVALNVFRLGGPTWFRIHTDQRRLSEFNEDGWSHCYRRVADMLLARPDVKGMVGTSWFYDPQLVEISPKLAYLQTTPLSHGAFLVRHGPGAVHTARATTRSATRRELYDRGAYLPVCYSLVWQRDCLLDWAGYA